MKARMKFFSAMFVALAFFAGETALAASKTLIEMKGDAPSAGLAKSWKKVKDGEYEFELDTTAELKKGVTVTPAAVKEALETKLGASDGVKVTEKGASAVSVTYTGDEKKFLEKVSKTKIRGKGGDSELAMEDSVSEGGIRAMKTDRGPKKDEVKASILKIEGDTIIATVLATKSSKVKANSKIKVKGKFDGLKAKDKFFFYPDSEADGVWTAKADAK